MSTKKNSLFAQHQLVSKKTSVPLQNAVPGFKPKAGILHKTKTVDYCVYYNGSEVTPKPLSQQFFKAVRERQLNVVNMADSVSSRTEVTNSQLLQRSTSAGRFKTEIRTADFDRSYLGRTIDETFLLLSVLTDTTESEKFFEESDEEGEEKLFEQKEIPTDITVILNETETFFLLDIPSSSEIKGTNEGNQVETANEAYEFLTVGKGKNRKMIDAMIQTHGILKKSRETEAAKRKTKNAITFASNWEMYDAFYLKKSATEVLDENAPSKEEQLHALNKSVSIESLRQSPEEKQLINLMKNENFLQAVLVIERLLANNNYNIQQKRFKGAIAADEFRTNIEFTYDLELLWTFGNDKTRGKCVTSMNWNPSNEDIIAVGYGKFYFTDKINGMVAIWNIKNPVQPERLFIYNESVSAVTFSHAQPHLVAIGFDNGQIEIIDIRKRIIKVVVRSSRDTSVSFDTVNYLTFYSGDEHYNFEEQLLACFNDGRICKYRLSMMTSMPCLQIMRAPEADGKIKGISKMIECNKPAVPLTKYTGALVITFHPNDPNIYFISTNAGVIHKCSTNYFNQHLDLLLTHDGPVYQMQFSPFCDKLYVTCGADWYVRIWSVGIHEPLLELVTTMYPVENVLWSPTHSTILVAIQNFNILIWDLHRKIHYPQHIIKSINGTRFSTINFTSNGKCLTVSDVQGQTYVYSLENMPFPPFFPDYALYTAIKKSLITKPELLKKFTSTNLTVNERSSKSANFV